MAGLSSVVVFAFVVVVVVFVVAVVAVADDGLPERIIVHASYGRGKRWGTRTRRKTTPG